MEIWKKSWGKKLISEEIFKARAWRIFLKNLSKIPWIFKEAKSVWNYRRIKETEIYKGEKNTTNSTRMRNFINFCVDFWIIWFGFVFFNIIHFANKNKENLRITWSVMFLVKGFTNGSKHVYVPASSYVNFLISNCQFCFKYLVFSLTLKARRLVSLRSTRKGLVVSPSW